MKKRFVFTIFISFMILSIFSFGANASNLSTSTAYSFIGVSEENIDEFSYDQKNSLCDTVITRYADGTVTENFYDFSTDSLIRNDVSELNVSPYLPESAYAPAMSSYIEDQYGRTQTSPTEYRSGHLVAKFDTDGIPGIDMYSYGSASLQHYDIIVSCAHCVWMPQYSHLSSDGWASEIIFYAGRSSQNTYGASANHVSVSISQNYVNNTTFTIDNKGNYHVNCDFNWDWSIIQLNQNLGSSYGWFGLHGCGEPEDGDEVYTIGYPSDKNFGTQWLSSGNIIGFNNSNIVYYDAYICSGNSGGPLLNNYSLYGIVTHYSYIGNNVWTRSGGTRMDPVLFGLIHNARLESAERWEE